VSALAWVEAWEDGRPPERAPGAPSVLDYDAWRRELEAPGYGPPCLECGGSGGDEERPCRACRGEGVEVSP